MSSYMILEGELDSKELSSISFTLVRVPYDIEKEIKYLEASNMPNKEIIIKSLKRQHKHFKNVTKLFLR